MILLYTCEKMEAFKSLYSPEKLHTWQELTFWTQIYEFWYSLGSLYIERLRKMINFLWISIHGNQSFWRFKDFLLEQTNWYYITVKNAMYSAYYNLGKNIFVTYLGIQLKNMNLDTDLIPFIKMNSKWITDVIENHKL